VILKGLNSLTTAQDIMDSMHSFGEIDAVAISKSHEGFGKFGEPFCCAACHSIR
jgi:hypothetical protein